MKSDRYKGEPIEGIQFYDLLMGSTEFTSELRKVTLVSERLEAELILLLKRNNASDNFQKVTLGYLVDMVHINKLITSNEASAFKMISKQRNYLTHNIYVLFNYQINKTILENENILDFDVHTYINMA